ncbi:MAG: hypothetical protein ABIZ80_15160, partial [Bryobacteraceae bacterium]
MPELKTSLKNLGPIRLLALDTSTLFLPFGRPVADYLRGGSAVTGGLEKLLRPGVLEFALEVRWSGSLAAWLRTTGVEGRPAEDPDFQMAGFLSMQVGTVAPKKAMPVKGSGALAPAGAEVLLPRMNTLPLRPRMTFGPPPAPPK